MESIIVQMSAPQWTEQALHLACAMARTTHSEVILLRMMETQHLSWLGTSYGVQTFSPEESARLWDYKAIAERYGVEFSIQPMQCVTYIDALVEARELMNAEAVFAALPKSRIPLWRKFQGWLLKRQLANRHCTLYTLDQPIRSPQPLTPITPMKQPVN